MSQKPFYNKVPVGIAEQIEKFKSRGLQISSEESAASFLATVSYYRLSGYAHHYLDKTNVRNKVFKPGTTFGNIHDLYIFDRKLRLLLFDALERIEVTLRTQLVNELSNAHGWLWYLEQKLFKNQHHFAQTISELRAEISRSKEEFLVDHEKRFSNDWMPPANKALEVATFGCLSRIYANLKSGNEFPATLQIARKMNVANVEIFCGWLECLTVYRNACAHHARIWNRKFGKTPARMAKTRQMPWVSGASLTAHQGTLYPHLCIIAYLLNTIVPATRWGIRLNALLEEYNHVANQQVMGFVPEWHNEPLWKELLSR